MLSRRIVAARPLARAVAPAMTHRPQFVQQIRTALTEAEHAELADPNMVRCSLDAHSYHSSSQQQNGGYINPPAEKRNNRDPYADWWDKQDRRNYGEPVHEDNDIQGAIALHDYDHFKPGWGAVLLGTFVATAFGLAGIVSLYYPDRKSVPKTYEDGLEAELGGPRAVRVSLPRRYVGQVLTSVGTEAWRGLPLSRMQYYHTCI